MRGRGVDDACVWIVNQGHRFTCRVVRQAQEGDVGGVDQALALGDILALLRINAQYLDIGTARQILVDLQARCAFLAVDKNFVRHVEPL